MNMAAGQIRWQNTRTGQFWNLDDLQWAESAGKAPVQIIIFTGVDRIRGGWMEDFGDNSYVYDHGTNMDVDGHYAGDTPFSRLPKEVRVNIYLLIYRRLTYQLSKAIKPNMVYFSRSGWAASAAYCPVIWSGDQDPSWDSAYGYTSAINAGRTAGLSGYGGWAQLRFE